MECMTRKHFEALAKALRLNSPNPRSKAESALFGNIVHSCARVCGAANPRFDHDRFTRASGLEA